VNVDDEIEMEEVVHENDKMVAMSVVENEMEVMRVLIKRSKGHEKEFYEDKLSSLEFSKSVRSIGHNSLLDYRIKHRNRYHNSSEVPE
jgi:hypothetical protein